MINIRILFLLSFFLCYTATAQHRRSYLPNPKLTPGHTFDVEGADLCRRGYKSSAGDTEIALKCQVFDRYRIDRYEIGYNADHLIPVKLGGSNSVKNLWPQPLSGEWGWHRKNKLERRLRKLVCSGQLDLKTAQQEIVIDWISAYKKYVEPRRTPPSQPQ